MPYHHERYPSAPYALVLVPFVFQSALHVGPVPAKAHVFLDKVCVHQTDSQRKKDGIASLNLVVFFSHYFVVVDTSDYLQRLWTVYELGSFLVLKNGGVPNMLPVNLYVGIAVFSATSAIGNICAYVLGQTSCGDGLVHEHTSYFQFFLYTGDSSDGHFDAELGARAAHRSGPSSKFQHQRRKMWCGGGSYARVQEHQDHARKPRLH